MVLSNFVDVGRDNAFDLTDAWVAILESAAKSESVCKELQQRKLALPALRMNYKPKTHELFDQIVPVATEFSKSLKWQAERQRRTTTATTGNGIDGFRLVDLLFHLYENIPGLYEHGFSRESVHRLFKPNRLGSRKASEHHCVIDARVSKKSNSARKMCDGTHFARSQQKLLQEWFVYHGQVLMSGDDMNIIQIGRPAVSRYHQQQRFFMAGDGPDHQTHDFPSSHLGLKLGGFMTLHSPAHAQTVRVRRHSV